jgi:hypothetical protein
MNTEKIEKLKKGLTNSQIPESLREKIREQIKKMEAEDLKESAPKVVDVAPKEKEEPTPAPKVEKAKVTRTPRVKKVVAQKESTAKKPTAMALAKDIRKDGESWKEAVKRASSEMKKGTTETKKAVVETKKATITEMQKLLKFVKRRKELKGVSGTNLQRDASRSAKPKGVRKVTHSGETSNQYGTYDNHLGRKYTENRDRHSDRLAPNYPKGAPKLANGGFMDGVYAENGAEVYRKKASENQKEKEKSMVFKKYRVNVYEDSYPFVDPHYTDNFVEAVNFAKKTIKEQKQYRPSSKDLFTSIDKFTPIEQRGNVIYPYYEIARFNEKDLNESKFANGGMMNNMSVHDGTDFMNTPVYKRGGGINDFFVGQHILLLSVPSPKEDRFYNKEVIIEEIKNNKITKSFVRKTGEKVPFVIDSKFRIEQYANGGFMDGVYAEEGAEVNYMRNKDGIRVKSVAMPEERLTEAEWLAKHNESREARTYAVGGGIFADTFSGYTGTHYTGLVGETNAMSSGEMFMAGGRVRRTKAQMTKDRENKEIDAYNWYVVDLEENKAITGNEYKEDAVDALSDYDGDKRYKVVSKKTLKSLGIENPNERFKSYEVGGGVGNFELLRKIINEFGNPPKGADIRALRNGIVEVYYYSPNEIAKKWAMKIRAKYGYGSDILYGSGIIYVDTLSIGKKYDNGGDLFENYDEQPEELAEITNFYAQKFDEDDYDYEDSKNFLKAVEAIGYTFDYGLDNEPYGLRPIGTELNEYARGGGVRTQNGREYSLGRNWTNDHRHENKDEDYEVPMYKRK